MENANVHLFLNVNCTNTQYEFVKNVLYTVQMYFSPKVPSLLRRKKKQPDIRQNYSIVLCIPNYN